MARAERGSSGWYQAPDEGPAIGAAIDTGVHDASHLGPLSPWDVFRECPFLGCSARTVAKPFSAGKWRGRKVIIGDRLKSLRHFLHVVDAGAHPSTARRNPGKETWRQESRQTVMMLFTRETTESRSIRNHDAGKKIRGRKRHIVIDTLGLHPVCFPRSSAAGRCFFIFSPMALTRDRLKMPRNVVSRQPLRKV